MLTKTTDVSYFWLFLDFKPHFKDFRKHFNDFAQMKISKRKKKISELDQFIRRPFPLIIIIYRFFFNLYYFLR